MSYIVYLTLYTDILLTAWRYEFSQRLHIYDFMVLVNLRQEPHRDRSQVRRETRCTSDTVGCGDDS